MRQLLISILFFFGPMVLMFLTRHFFLLLRVWLAIKKNRNAKGEDVIDITPVSSKPPSKVFMVSAVAVSILITFLVWQRMSSEHASSSYEPAYLGEDGRIHPGKM